MGQQQSNEDASVIKPAWGNLGNPEAYTSLNNEGDGTTLYGIWVKRNAFDETLDDGLVIARNWDKQQFSSLLMTFYHVDTEVEEGMENQVTRKDLDARSFIDSGTFTDTGETFAYNDCDYVYTWTSAHDGDKSAFLRSWDTQQPYFVLFKAPGGVYHMRSLIKCPSITGGKYSDELLKEKKKKKSVVDQVTCWDAFIGNDIYSIDQQRKVLRDKRTGRFTQRFDVYFVQSNNGKQEE